MGCDSHDDAASPVVPAEKIEAKEAPRPIEVFEAVVQRAVARLHAHSQVLRDMQHLRWSAKSEAYVAIVEEAIDLAWAEGVESMRQYVAAVKDLQEERADVARGEETRR